MSKIDLDRFCVISVQYQQYSYDYFLESLKKCGLNKINLWGAIPHYYRPMYKDYKKKISEINKKNAGKEMEIVVFTPETLAYPYSFTNPDDDVRNKTVEFFETAMDDAKSFGCNQIFLNSGCGLRDVPIERSWELLIDTYKQIAKIAEKKNIQLVLEQLQPYESNLVYDIKGVEKTLKAVNSDALGVCLDVVAMAVAGESVDDYFNKFGEKIGLIQYADTYHYILGDGQLPIKEYLKAIEKYNYKGIIDLEVNDSIYFEDPHSAISKSVEWLKQNYL